MTPSPPADDGQLQGTTNKRKRNRKGLGKRFDCTAEGCGRSYSRAEHLYRHQLNHNSRQIFYCEYPDCPRTFVRGDLLKRHMDRHAHRGSHLGRRDLKHHHLDHQPPFRYQSPSAAASNTPPPGPCSATPPINDIHGHEASLGSYDAFPPQMTPQHLPAPFVPPPPQQAAVDARFLSPYIEAASLCEPSMVSMAGQIFGDHQVLSKSSCVGMSQDFMAHLFNPLPSTSGSSPAGLAAPNVNIGAQPGDGHQEGGGEYHYSLGGCFSAAPQQHHQQQHLEATLSEEKSRELFGLIRHRFHEQNVPPPETLSRRMMQAYITSYWNNVSDQMPILHRASFSPNQTPNLLLLAIMTLGAGCMDRTAVSDFLARHLRWEMFTDQGFRPPAQLWLLQALVLLELYEKMYSTRAMHERAHVHHGSMMTLMRRSLTGQKGGGGSTAGDQGWWRDWIATEAMRRVAFACLVIDATHAAMFGHSAAVMAAHELRQVVPCDEALWRAGSSSEFARIQASSLSSLPSPAHGTTLLQALRQTLSQTFDMPTLSSSPFGRTVLMAGLLSVSLQMQQRDVQVKMLGGDTPQDSWRTTMAAAYDFWKGNRSNDDEDDDEDGEDESTLLLHHLAHMTLHADIVDCQIFAGAKRLLGRVITPHEFGAARQRLHDSWARTPRARDATLHALKLLSSVLLRGPYDAHNDILLNRPWVLFLGALIVWCYGFALEGPGAAPTTMGPIQEMRRYLLRFGAITEPSHLQTTRGVNQNTALLMVLRESFQRSRWELLREAAQLLSNCLVLNTGGDGRSSDLSSFS
ncbi:hypothetical protein CP533_1768 [Ophiocordyceps camponoti-saundersi (nom. inval.)]|nr:hypothetical protein CP533_1768 [Ophiocordyceps camponoti-saundersi (nom. inval.)]